MDMSSIFFYTVGGFVWLLLVYSYLRFTNGLGRSILIIFSFLYVAIFFIHPWISILIAILLLISIIISHNVNRRIKNDYQRAQAIFEGGGIRRGLTPPEVAVIMGMSFPRIVVLILVGLLDKGFVKLNAAQDWGFQVVNQMKAREVSMSTKKRAEFRCRTAQELKQIIYPFEEIFLELIEQVDGKGIDEIDFSISVKPLIKLVSERIGGYDLSDSREYYQKIILKKTGGEDFRLIEDLNLNCYISWIILGIDNDIMQDDKVIDCKSEWLIDSINPVGSKLTKKTLKSWVLNLESQIKLGLNENNFKYILNGELDGTSFKMIRDIIHAT